MHAQVPPDLTASDRPTEYFGFGNFPGLILQTQGRWFWQGSPSPVKIYPLLLFTWLIIGVSNRDFAALLLCVYCEDDRFHGSSSCASSYVSPAEMLRPRSGVWSVGLTGRGDSRQLWQDRRVHTPHNTLHHTTLYYTLLHSTALYCDALYSAVHLSSVECRVVYRVRMTGSAPFPPKLLLPSGWLQHMTYFHLLLLHLLVERHHTSLSLDS